MEYKTGGLCTLKIDTFPIIHEHLVPLSVAERLKKLPIPTDENGRIIFLCSSQTYIDPKLIIK